MHKVIVKFVDLKDNNHVYYAGDIFPRKGLEVSDERLDELSTNKNRRGIPLIEKVKESKPEPVEEKTEEPTETVEETTDEVNAAAEVIEETQPDTKSRKRGRKKE